VHSERSRSRTKKAQLHLVRSARFELGEGVLVWLAVERNTLVPAFGAREK
jgi:hypothetical protein